MARPKGTFFERTEALQRLVGDGELTGVVTVDQPYAAPQHEGVWRSGPLAGVRIRNHPKGGGPPPSKYLETPIKENAQAYAERLAANVLNGRLSAEMVAITDDLIEEVAKRAPLDQGVLRGSGQATVYDQGRPVHHRPPKYPRMSEADGAEV
jgi:hypothetical protein